MWYIHTTEYYFNYDSEGNPAFFNSIDGHVENLMLSEVSQTEKDKHCMISLYVESKKVELNEIQSIAVITGDWGELERCWSNVQTFSYKMN